jgi:ubiquinone/menaquinone biosynthesis C-methylase UbiE
MKRYDVTWDSYDQQYSSEQDAKYKAALNTLNSQSAPGIVLDVGCGSGLFFSQIANKADMTVGVDITHNLLLKAKTIAKTFPNVHVIQADADHLPFKTGVFDLVFCFTVLQNMPKPKETLLEFKRQGKPDGKIVVTGLKKAFELTIFLDLFEAAGLRMLSFVDDDTLRCYIAVTSTS